MSTIQPTGRAERQGPNCPLCGTAKSSWLCRSTDYDIWRCTACATDFVNPPPTEQQLSELYDREAWFEGAEHGGYASYDGQTNASPAWLEALFDSIKERRDLPSILDIGCAYGTHLSQAHARGWRCFGVEPSEHALKVARERHPDIYFTKTVEEVPPHRFDLILMLEVIEHLADPYAVFYELMGKGAIGRDTVIAITTPNARSADAVADPAGWKYRHPPSHLTFYSAQSFATLLRRLRFQEVDIKGQHPLADPSRTQSFADEHFDLNDTNVAQEGLLAIASGSDFAEFMQERYVPGTWSEIAAYEHRPRYDLACQFAAGKRVLDFGCGSGYGSGDLARVALHVTGIDISVDALSYARETHQATNLAFEQRSDFGEGLAKASFDLIVCFELIEHLAQADQTGLLKILQGLLAPGGKLLISTPNPATTALYGDNPFHLHEMKETEFRDALNAVFPHVRFIGQIIAPTVAFLPDRPKAEIRVEYALMNEAAPLRPSVFVALCGQEPLPELPAQLWIDSERDFVSTRTEAIKTRNVALLAQYELERQRNANRLLETASAALHHDIAVKNETLIAQQSALAASNREISLRDDKISALGDEISVRDEKLNATSASLHLIQTQIVPDLEGKLAAEGAEVFRLRQIESSTVWRSAMKLMPVFKALHPLASLLRRKRVAQRHPATLDAVAERPAAAVAHPENAPLDMLLETCRIPEWDEGASRYRTSIDQKRLEELRQAPPERAGLIAPYVVTPLIPVDATQRRPRILHVIPNVFVGGSTQLIIDILQHLSHHYEQEVLTSALWRGGNHIGMTVHCVPNPDPAAIREIYRAFKPDLVHVHYWGLTDDGWYMAAFEALDAIASARVVENINTPIAPLKHPRIDHYVYVSEYVRSTFGKAADDPAISSIIYPGIDLSQFSKPYDGQDAQNSIGMVYRLEDDKLRPDSIDLFIEVVKRRPRTRAVIIGGGSYLQPYLERTIAAGVRENFWFTGYVPYATLPELYDQFSIFVAPVWKESFGQVSPFAMAKGSAVAGYAIGALPEIVGRKDCFGTTLEEAAGIIVDILDNPARLESEGERNRDRARNLFSVEAMVSQYDALYSRLSV